VALAEMPNIGRLQKKVDESIKKVEVFNNMTSGSVPELELPLPEGPPPPSVAMPESAAPGETPIEGQEPAPPVPAPAAAPEQTRL
jgi:monofunctional biosynthetic peptidoglycan transglycosylase